MDADTAKVGPLRAPGVVVEVRHDGVVTGTNVDIGNVRTIIQRGMIELTARTTEDLAWQSFFGSEDVVVIKVNPFGFPKFYTRPETVAEIARGLKLAGVLSKNIIVYDRYTEYLAQVSYASLLPSDVQLVSAVSTMADQTSLQACDPNAFVEFPRVDDGLDPNNPQNRRSYLCDVVSNVATKVINVPVLKHHLSAGFTACLKNMTYGLFNNTERSHLYGKNWTDEFLPGVAAHPTLQKKVVLNIVDALIACYDQGPGPNDFIFDYQSMLFATDPVAADRICWNIVNKERELQGLPPVESPTGREPQPYYVDRCGALGLGISETRGITHRKLVV